MKLCVSITLNVFDFVPVATSLSMFPLIQWLSDLAMFVVVAFTSHHNKDAAPGVSIQTTRDRIHVDVSTVIQFYPWHNLIFFPSNHVHYNL